MIVPKQSPPHRKHMGFKRQSGGVVAHSAVNGCQYAHRCKSRHVLVA
jgi:hypothetical protein